MTTLDSLTSAALREAAAIKDQIEQLGARLGEILGGEPESPSPATKTTSAGRKTMSPAARTKIAAAQRARWAKTKGTASSFTVAKPETPKKKGGLTPEGRARLAASMKARWAARRKAA
jgi:hypothetical protein